MTNCITINISFLGNDRRIGELVAQARGKPKPSGDLRESDISGEHFLNLETCFEFNQLVPLPDAFSKVPYNPQGYDMEIEAWGVMWGAFAHIPPAIDEGHAMYQFECAWSVPWRFLETLSQQWPDVWIVASYGGEGPVRGRLVLYQGAYVERTNGEDDSPEPDDETLCQETGYEWLDAHSAWVDYYLRHHEDFVEYVLSTYILKESEKEGGQRDDRE